MGDSTRTSTPAPDQEPGHYGAGYGEQVAAEATPQLGPSTDGDPTPAARDERPSTAPRDEAGVTSEGDDGEAVVFTPDDVHVRPPDEPPTDAAPESEKAGLIFERS